jgi:hypothetical protein
VEGYWTLLLFATWRKLVERRKQNQKAKRERERGRERAFGRSFTSVRIFGQRSRPSLQQEKAGAKNVCSNDRKPVSSQRLAGVSENDGFDTSRETEYCIYMVLCPKYGNPCTISMVEFHGAMDLMQEAGCKQKDMLQMQL